MSTIIEYDHSYLNTTPGRFKVTCLVLSVIGILAVKLGGYTDRGDNFCYVASVAFTVTGILLLLFICKSSFRHSVIWLKIEIIICAILTIAYVFATIDIFRVFWYFLFNHFNLIRCISYLIALICGIFSITTYAYDTSLKYKDLRETPAGGLSAV